MKLATCRDLNGAWEAIAAAYPRAAMNGCDRHDPPMSLIGRGELT
jgi:hypothetical protein